MEYLVFFFTFSGSWYTIYLVLLNQSTIHTDFNVVIEDPLNLKSKFSHNSSDISPKKFNFQFPTLDDAASLPIVQSQKCSPQELKLLIQCFKEIPLTDYFVLVNDSLSISCVVNNQHGKVQWRAKNLVLGYDRAVPGMPRLQIVGDVTKGEHNLHIIKAQTQDSGDYECQVQPVDAHPLLRRRSTLHVTSLPSLPFIFYKNEIPKNNEIIIDFNLKIKAILKLLCVSQNGYPLPIFQWFWNSREIVTDDVEFILVTNNESNQSTLAMPITFLKSGHQISCVVKNKATELLEARTPGSLRRFEVKVTIIMFVRSGNPVIENTENIVSENDDMELLCSLKPTGHPKANLRWKIISTTSHEIRNTINIQYNEKNDEIITKLHLKNLSRSDHRLNVSCMAQSLFDTKSSKPFQLFVRHRPTQLSIITFDSELENIYNKINLHALLRRKHKSVVNGVENEDVNMLCFTNSYYGTLTMKWLLQHGDYFYGTKSTMQILSPMIKSNYNLTHNDTIQTFITQKVKLKRSFNSGFLECQVQHKNQAILSRKINFNVYYEPKLSVISGYVSQFPVHEGDTIHLTCCAYGGNPTPTLRWYKNNSVVLISHESKEEKDEQTLVFLYRVFKQDNGQKIYCEAKNENVPVKVIKSNSLTINVIFPPSGLEITCINCTPEGIIANTTSEFLCESSSSNPGSLITWKLFNCSSSEGENLTNCVSTVLEGSLSTNFPGQYNGWKSQSRLNLKLDYQQNNFILQCQSRLTHKISPDKYKPISKNIRVSVLHQPFIVNKLKVPDIFEGTTLNLEYKILSNPNPSAFAWYFEDRLISSDPNLVIENVQFNNSGKYTFAVENRFGNTKASVEIDIKYSPRIYRSSVNISTNAAVLWCEASMNPIYANYSSVWTRVEAIDRLSFARSSEMVPILSANYSCISALPADDQLRISVFCGVHNRRTLITKLTISPYQDSDFGWYQCSFDNGIGHRGFENIHLNLPTKPWHLKISQYSKQGADISHHSLLTCCFLSHVNPSIFWTVPFSSEIFSSTNTSEIRQSTFCSILLINVKEKKYFGQYGCQATNEKGSSRMAYVNLQSTFQPDFPENFRVIIVSNNDIKVSWIKGSDGGSPQTFQLRWRSKKQKSIYHHKTVPGNQTREIVYTTISNFSSGTYTIDIGVNSIRYPDYRFCCALTFLILSNINETIDNIDTKSQNHFNYPDVTLEKLNWGIYYIIIGSSIVVFLSLFFALFILICVMKHRRKPLIGLKNRNKTVVVDELLKLSDTLNENKNEIDAVDITEDIRRKRSPSEPKELLIDQETIKFLTPVSQISLFNYIPISCPSMELSKSFINEYTPTQSISQNVTGNSSNPVLCQGVYGRFVMEKWQPCDCHLSVERDGIILMTNQ